MFRLHPPVLRSDGRRTCAWTTEDDQRLELETPVVRWNGHRSRLETVDERGKSWIERLSELEAEALRSLHRARYDAKRHPHLSDLRRGFCSCVDASGTCVHVDWTSPPAHETLVRTRVQIRDLEWTARGGCFVRVSVVPEHTRTVPTRSEYLFRTDEIFLYPCEVDQLVRRGSADSSSASLKKGSSVSSTGLDPAEVEG